MIHKALQCWQITQSALHIIFVLVTSLLLLFPGAHSNVLSSSPGKESGNLCPGWRLSEGLKRSVKEESTENSQRLSREVSLEREHVRDV